jgi:hypothetical protein
MSPDYETGGRVPGSAAPRTGDTARDLLRRAGGVFQQISAEYQATTRIESMAGQMASAIEAFLRTAEAERLIPAQQGALREIAQRFVIKQYGHEPWWVAIANAGDFDTESPEGVHEFMLGWLQKHASTLYTLSARPESVLLPCLGFYVQLDNDHQEALN